MNKTLVAYFSASGVTAKLAKNLAQAADADLYEIKPAVPYTAEDLDWHNKESRSSIEMGDKSSRPELADKDADIDSYDVVYLGFPIWWYVAPTIINTFLESYSFSGKKIILFATSGGSGMGKTLEGLEESCNGAHIMEGKVLKANSSVDELKNWILTLV